MSDDKQIEEIEKTLAEIKAKLAEIEELITKPQPAPAAAPVEPAVEDWREPRDEQGYRKP